MPNSAIFLHIEYPNMGKPNSEKFFFHIQNLESIVSLSQYLGSSLFGVVPHIFVKAFNLQMILKKFNQINSRCAPCQSLPGRELQLQKWKSGEARHAILRIPSPSLPISKWT